MAPKAPQTGNTKQSAPRINACKRWCLTYFSENGSDGAIILEEIFKKLNANYILGRECCPTTGKVHIQGYVEFKSKMRPLENHDLKKLNAHWEKAKGNRQDNIVYCSKENKYITNIPIKKPIIDPLMGKEMKPFQKDITNLIHTEPDDRTIFWYWDEQGKTGKTSIAKHLCIKYPNQVLFVNGAGKDVKYAVSEFVNNEDNDLQMIIFYFTRSVEGFISYEAIESCKDGILFNNKYESKMCIFNCPHVVCMANFEPDTERLSIDRWKIVNVN